MRLRQGIEHGFSAQLCVHTGVAADAAHGHTEEQGIGRTGALVEGADKGLLFYAFYPASLYESNYHKIAQISISFLACFKFIL